MICDCRRKDYEKEPERPMIRNEYRTIQKSDPHKTDWNDLDLQRDSFMFHEIPDVWPQLGMIQ